MLWSLFVTTVWPVKYSLVVENFRGSTEQDSKAAAAERITSYLANGGDDHDQRGNDDRAADDHHDHWSPLDRAAARRTVHRRANRHHCASPPVPQLVRSSVGEFRWEPSPANQPLHIDSVALDPPHPITAQTVTVTIHWSDPDADIANVSMWCTGVGPCAAASFPSPIRCDLYPKTYGPWAPPPPRPGSGTLVEHLQYQTAGTFNWEYEIFTTSSAVEGFARDHSACVPGNLYSSSGSASGSITVVDLFPPANP